MSRSDSYVVSTTTRVPGTAARIRPVADTPSPSGIRRSISTMSGRSATAAATPAAPEDGLADHGEVGFGVQHAAQAVPHHRVVVDQQDPDHAGTSSSIVVPRSGVARHGQRAVHLLGPGPHAGQPEPVAPSLGRSKPRPSSRTTSRTVRVPVGEQRPAPRVAAACRRTLVSASWAVRSSTTSTAVGSGRCVAGDPHGRGDAGLLGEAGGLPAYGIGQGAGRQRRG